MFKLNKKVLVMNRKDYNNCIIEIAKDNKETIEINEKALKVILAKEDITTRIDDAVIKDGIIEISNMPKAGFYTCYNTEGFIEEYGEKVNKMIDSVLSVELEHLSREKGRFVGRKPTDFPLIGKLFK